MTSWAHRYSEPLLWLAGAAIVLALSGVPRCAWAGYAEADEPVQVTPSLVCAVQSAIKLHRTPAWKPDRCEQVAGAMNSTGNPGQTLAIAVNESDLNEKAIHWRATGGADVGLMGVFCAVEKGAKDDTCKNVPGGVPIKLRELFEPTASVYVATAILAEKGGSLRRYNGGTREHGYEARIAAVMSALGGVEVRAKGARMRKLVGQIAKAVRP